jgi:hypothetical protein
MLEAIAALAWPVVATVAIVVVCSLGKRVETALVTRYAALEEAFVEASRTRMTYETQAAIALADIRDKQDALTRRLTELDNRTQHMRPR